MKWRLKQTSGTHMSSLGDSGTLEFLYDKTVFVFRGQENVLTGHIISYLGAPDVRCQEVWVKSDIGEFIFECESYEKIGDVLFCRSQSL